MPPKKTQPEDRIEECACGWKMASVALDVRRSWPAWTVRGTYALNLFVKTVVVC